MVLCEQGPFINKVVVKPLFKEYSAVLCQCGHNVQGLFKSWHHQMFNNSNSSLNSQISFKWVEFDSSRISISFFLNPISRLYGSTFCSLILVCMRKYIPILANASLLLTLARAFDRISESYLLCWFSIFSKPKYITYLLEVYKPTTYPMSIWKAVADAWIFWRRKLKRFAHKMSNFLSKGMLKGGYSFFCIDT